jgi:hypothetical protein
MQSQFSSSTEMKCRLGRKKCSDPSLRCRFYLSKPTKCNSSQHKRVKCNRHDSVAPFYRITIGATGGKKSLQKPFTKYDLDTTTIEWHYSATDAIHSGVPKDVSIISPC